MAKSFQLIPLWYISDGFPLQSNSLSHYFVSHFVLSSTLLRCFQSLRPIPSFFLGLGIAVCPKLHNSSLDRPILYSWRHEQDIIPQVRFVTTGYGWSFSTSNWARISSSLRFHPTYPVLGSLVMLLTELYFWCIPLMLLSWHSVMSAQLCSYKIWFASVYRFSLLIFLK